MNRSSALLLMFAVVVALATWGVIVWLNGLPVYCQWPGAGGC